MDAGVLGPLRIVAAAGEVPITGVKERTVLAHLVARVGQVVPAEEMVDALWPDDPPRTAQRTLQSYVARVRSALDQGGAGAGLIVTEGRGYMLTLDPGDIDAHRFVRLVELGRSAAADGQPQAAAETLSAALGLWRGPAYAGFESTVFGRAEGRRLGQLRLAVVEDWLEARVAAGKAPPSAASWAPSGSVAAPSWTGTDWKDRGFDQSVTRLGRWPAARLSSVSH